MFENAVGDDLAPAGGQPLWDRRGVIDAGHDQGRTIAGEPPKMARLPQIIGRVVQPKEPAPRPADEPDDAVAAIADVEIASARKFTRQRAPAHAFVDNSRTAAVARVDLVA